MTAALLEPIARFRPQPALVLRRSRTVEMGENTAGVTEETQVSRAQAGDQDAWASLYRIAYPRLIAYARHRLGSAEEAKEAVAEVMARAVTHIDRFSGSDSAFTAWLVGILRNVVADIQRAKYRFTREPMPELVASGPSPMDYVMEGVEREIVRAAFAQLDAKEKEILELRVVAGLASEDVAEMLGRQPSAIRMAQMRALQRLRVFVEELSRVG